MNLKFEKVYFKSRRTCVRCGDTIKENDKKYRLTFANVAPEDVNNFIEYYRKNRLNHNQYPYCKKCMAIVKLRGRL